MAAPSPQDIAAGVPAQANIVQRVDVPGGGQYLVGADGGVFAIGGAKYGGSVPGLQGDTLAGQHQFGGNGLTLGPNGGYVETDSAGHQYAFGGAPAPNPLAQDPAYLAFLRTSGNDYDQYVRDFENTVGLNQRHNAAALAQLNDPFGQEALGRQNTLQDQVNRGVAGGVAQDRLTGYDTETAGKKAQIGSDLADQNTAAGQTFSQGVGTISNKGIEQGIQTGQDQGWQKFLQGEAQKYPDMADKIMGSGNAPSGGQ